MLHEEKLITDAERKAIHAINGHGSAMANAVYVKRSFGRDVANGVQVFKVMGMGGTAGTNDTDVSMYNADANMDTADANMDSADTSFAQSDPIHFNSQGNSMRQEHSPINQSMHHHSLTPVTGNHSLTPVTGNRVWYQTNSSPRISLDSRFNEIEWGNKRNDQNKRVVEGVSRFEWLDVEVEFVGTWCIDYKRKHPQSKISAVTACRDALMSNEYSELHGYFHVSHIANTSRLTHGYKAYCRKHGLQ